MSECLQEEVMQSYLDGELRGQRAEQVASHLTACVACTAFARELEQENSVLAAALAPEFESAVPSERLRQRIDAAIASTRVEAASTHNSASSLRDWLSSVSDLFTFRPQRALGYASLMLVVGFGLIMGMMRWQTSPTVQPTVAFTPVTPAVNPAPDATAPVNSAGPISETPSKEGQVASVANNLRPRRNAGISPATSRQYESRANHVKLLPGERSYLQTIAQLDLTIKSEKATMKPGVQAEYQRNLAFVDRTLAVARTAAKSNPNDPDATEFMFSAYQSKVDLLNTVAQARVLDK
ncbi:MAG: zf-HC2 domain-containing protein [bacterium]